MILYGFSTYVVVVYVKVLYQHCLERLGKIMKNLVQDFKHSVSGSICKLP
jgi:hypothetical protein